MNKSTFIAKVPARFLLQWKILFILIVIPLLLSSCARQNQKKMQGNTPQITVAVAASLMPPVEEISKEFETKYRAKVILVSASSGVITSQIINGAPFDVFISADLAHPQKLEQQKLTIRQNKTFALGSLVLWSKININDADKSTFLSSGNIKTLGIANPDLAPFGAAALRWLRQKRLDRSDKFHLIYSENIGSLNQLIHSGAVDAALTSDSARHTKQLQHIGYWFPVDDAATIPHVAVLINRKPPKDTARQFIDFLADPAAQRILTRYGYKLPENP